TAGSAGPIPRPLARGAGAAHRQTDARRGATVRLRPRDVPAAAGTGAARGGGAQLLGCDPGGRAHRLLGPPAPPHAGAVAPRLGRRAVSLELPVAHAPAHKSRGDGPPPERLVRPAAAESRPGRGLNYRKLKSLNDTPELPASPPTN